MTDLQAAIGLAQLDKLSRFTARRSANAAFYGRRLAEHVRVPVTRPGHLHVYHQYTIRVPRARDAFARALADRGIETAIHYPQPIHKQPIYQARDDTGQFPVADAAADEVLSLPVHPGLSEEDLETVAREVIALCQ
jgi:dTDP-4-amino-4,6-dideoxygalactose transaminase